MPWSLIVYAYVASALAGILCGSTGVLASKLGLRTVAFSMSHAAMAGAAIGLYAGLNPEAVAFILAAATAVALGPLAEHTRIPSELVSMALFSGYTAMAFIFTYLSPGTALSTRTLSLVFWGSVLAVTPGYIILLLTSIVSIALLLLSFWPQLSTIFFDRKIAEAEGINTKAYIYMATIISGITVILVLKLVGGFLVFSLLYTPAAASTKVGRTLRGMVAASAFFGTLSGVLGVTLSLVADLPVGACISLSSTVILLISILKEAR